MKRLLVSILAILYFAVSSGATVHLHYCMGKLVQVSLIEDDSEDCAHCGMKKNVCKKKCCKEDKKIIKSSDQNPQPNLAFDFAVKHFVDLPSYIPFSYSEPIFEQKTSSMYLAHAPPSVWRTCPIYIQVQNFRI